MNTLEIHQFPCLSDNYGYLIHDAEHNVTATIDTPDASAIHDALNLKGWQLTHILNTHHHFDHAGGNLELKEATGCVVVGPLADRNRIPGIDIEVGEGDVYRFGGHDLHVHDTPGHTRGHIVYHIPGEKVAFVGDTLFSMGCGRLFEGTPEQMWDSLRKILTWPDDTSIHCAHEYTMANGMFALSVDPDNAALQARMDEVQRLRNAGVPTVPTLLGLEKQTNPFLRPDSDGIRDTLGMRDHPVVEVFAETRRRKDNF